MRGAGLVAAVVIVAAILIGAGLYVVVLSKSGEATGFDPTELRAPSAANARPVNNSLPTPLTASVPSYDDLNLYWNITEDIYAGYGGALDLTIQNLNPGKLYVYSFGMRWETGETFYRNCSVTIGHNQKANIGVLIFGAPASGQRDYTILIKVAASNAYGTAWHDVGELSSTDSTAYVSPLGAARDVDTDVNTPWYYNTINERVSYGDAMAVANAIKARYPGSYSVLQIAETFAWVKKNIEYVADPSGDYWQSAGETLDLATGDCEDHAILVASIIGALGGSARVNLIEQHAFPTVFVAPDHAGLMKVKQALASYYGVDNATYHMSYLEDEHGYWLVVDTTGFPYAGGVPAKSEPTSASGNWTVQSSYLHAIDATGVPSPGGFLSLF